MRSLFFLSVLFAMAAGCSKKVPAEFDDVAPVVATGQLQGVYDGSIGVSHPTEAGQSTIFQEYAAALKSKGWEQTKDVPKPDTKPPAHNGCFKRAEKQIAVAASRQGPKLIGVVVRTGCVGI